MNTLNQWGKKYRLTSGPGGQTSEGLTEESGEKKSCVEFNKKTQVSCPVNQRRMSRDMEKDTEGTRRFALRTEKIRS